MLPFDRTAFLDVFAAYNEAVWPAQPIAWLLGIFALAALVRGEDRLQRFVLWVLAAMWLWTGLAYHWLFFAEVNPAAILFGFLFALEAGLLGLIAAGGEVRFGRPPLVASTFLGAALIVCAIVFYPLTDLVLGHWPRMPAFGISPCPVTLFTLGFLLLAQPRPPAWVWAIPVAWSLVGGSAALLLGIVQDWVLLVAGPAAVLLLVHEARAKHRTSP